MFKRVWYSIDPPIYFSWNWWAKLTLIESIIVIAVYGIERAVS